MTNSETTLTQRMHWQGREIAWTRLGAGQPVVFCHGTPWSSWLWREAALALSHDFSVYLWDMPGYGLSSMHSDHAVDLDVQGQVLACLLDHWGLQGQAHVVAHDFGGAVSLRAHLVHGAAYRSLCLVDVVALGEWGSPFFRLVADNHAVFEQLPPHIHQACVQAYIQSAAHQPLAAHVLQALCRPWLSPAGQQAFYRQIAQADQRFTQDIEVLYPSIAIPTHIIWGEADSWIPLARGQALQAVIPGASLERIAGAGHLIQLDAPTALGVALHRWLRAQSAACVR
ncbi:alpha/beta fold hydrolase [Ottowia sp.]|uniref:alpha/beta fold hydrolase n=1 Tax=Ottowia sp. TaxID=1898956 RepID=UPI003A88387E